MAQNIHLLVPETQLQPNALARRKKGSDVKKEQPIPMADAIFINISRKMLSI
jgi:hypothetical protein